MSDDLTDRLDRILGKIGDCLHCGAPIRRSTVFEFTVTSPGRRRMDIWTHAASGHERCEGRDTYAKPREEPQP